MSRRPAARARWRRVPAVVLTIWIVTAVVLWNGIYDLRISIGTREYLLQAALHDAGRGPAVSMPDAMRETVGQAVKVASFWTALIALAAIWSTARLLTDTTAPAHITPPDPHTQTPSG